MAIFPLCYPCPLILPLIYTDRKTLGDSPFSLSSITSVLPSSHISPEILCSFSLTFQVPQDRCHAACCAPLSLSSARLVGALGPPLTGIAPVGLEGPLIALWASILSPSYLTGFSLLLTDYSLLEMLHIPGFPCQHRLQVLFPSLSAVSASVGFPFSLSTLKQGKDSQP